jgi:radical SAM-linked protein
VQAVRIRFKKHGRARFISHLDLNRCMARAIRRAGIPVWHTEGFNPHPYITFALPLSIFYEGMCEVMDTRLDGEMALDEVKKRLSEQMPEGIEIYDVCEPVMKVTELAFARYVLSLEFENSNADQLNVMFAGLLAQPELMIEKNTKHGTREIDVKPYLSNENAHFEIEDGIISLETVLPAGQDNLNPSCFSAALLKYAEVRPDFEKVTRTQIYDAQMQPFA